MASTAPELPEFLTASEVAAVFRVQPGTVSGWARRGVLAAVRPKGVKRALFRREDVLDLLESEEP